MTDNKRLILDATLIDQAEVTQVTDNPQAINTAVPADVVILPTTESITVEGVVRDPVDDLSPAGAEVLFIPVVVGSAVDEVSFNITDALRLSANRSTPTAVDVTPDLALAMISRIRFVDDYLTIVDLFDQAQPGVHYLLREGGGGFVTYENGNRILIL
jgi:hypothetical protein